MNRKNTLTSEVLRKRTQRSFGFQWTNFSEMSCDFKENFLNYIHPLTPEFFKGKLGLDAGCGFGRHLYNAASFGAKMVGMDFSDAIEASQKNTSILENVYLVKGDIYNPPFREDVFDFVYSIGVLHHLPEPQKGFDSLIRFIKRGGSIFIWVYSKKRKMTNFLLESFRRITQRLPMRIIKYISCFCALVDWACFILPYRILRKIPFLRNPVIRYTLERIKIYSKYPFQVCYADWFDRLSAPVRFYYDKDDLLKWAESACLRNVIISPTGKYGWRLYAQKI
jgi:SAM-dependent methyltransferase